jgi:hypothetical protein
VHVTEEEITANGKTSAVEEGSDNQLDEPQEFTTIKKFLELGRNGIVVVINYVGSSTDQEL